MNLSVITTTPRQEKPPFNHVLHYIQGVARNMEAAVHDTDARRRFVYYGIKYFAKCGESELLESSQARFNIAIAIKAGMELLTPQELITCFPIDKHYGGEKYQSKDYFYTMKMLQEHGMDTKIGSNVDDILWDYQNIWVRLFNVALMGLLDDLRRAEGKPGMVEEFFGLKPWTEHVDAKGRRVMVQKETGKVAVVKKKRPRYLRPVK